MKETNKASEISKKKIYLYSCIILVVVSAVLLPVFLRNNPTSVYRGYLDKLHVGEIASQDIIAKYSVELIDDKATKQAKEIAKNSIHPIYSFSVGDSLETIRQMDMLKTAVSTKDFELAVSVIGDSLAKRLFEIEDPSVLITVLYDVVNKVVSAGYFKFTEVSETVSQGYSYITITNNLNKDNAAEYEVSTSTLITEAGIRGFVSETINSYGAMVDSQSISLIENICSIIIQPNVFSDVLLTEERQQEAVASTNPSVISIKKGQYLITQNHVVTNDMLNVLKLLSGQKMHYSFSELAGNIVFVIVATVLFYYVFALFINDRNQHFLQYLIIVTVGLILTFVATYFSTVVSSGLDVSFRDSFLPIFFLPLFLTMVTNFKRIGLLVSFAISTYMTTLPNAGIMTFFYCLLITCCSVYCVRFMNKRLDMIYQWFFSCVITMAITVLFMMITDSVFTSVFAVLSGVAINVSIAYLLLAILIPISEIVLNLPTVFRLHELAYSDSPVLNRLAKAAPGTYSHSRLVAELAEAGANSIGANALLARVGGLYHDIGKMEHPEYFIENQNQGTNKHDEINPGLSVAIIKSHVKVGVEKAREAGLPPEVVRIISTHHGNDIISYFYHEALKSMAASPSNRREDVKAEDYSYGNDPPDSPEGAIVMLADCVEAASRTVTPNAGKFEKLISQIFLGKIERKQLTNSNLTFAEIDHISDAFVKTLVARYHSRIEYPDEDEE